MKKWWCGIALLAAAVAAGNAPAQTAPAQEEPVGVILENPYDPLYGFGIAYVGESRFEGYGNSALFEMDADWDVAYFRNVLGGDIALMAAIAAILPFESTELDLPSQLVQVSADTAWTWRYVNDTALQVRVAPGLYSDLEEFGGEAFFLPFSVAGLMPIAPNATGTAGVQIRPGFERTLMPILSLAWKVTDNARLDAGLPASRFVYSFNRRWSGQAGFEWRSRTFAIDDERDKITVEDLRLSAGAVYKVSDQFHVLGEVGDLFARKVVFDRAAEGESDDVDIESAPLLRFALMGPF